MSVPNRCWLYGDDAQWHSGDSPWDVFGAPFLDKGETVKTMQSPLESCQRALERTRTPWIDFLNGRWKINEEQRVVVLQPPENHGFEFAFHYETLKLFRSAEAGSGKLVSTHLRQVVEPMRGWMQKAMNSGQIPGGKELLARERGETSSVAVVPRKLPPTPLPDPLLPASLPAARLEPAPTPTPAQEIRPMALLDIEKKVHRVMIVETTRTVEIDREKFLRVLRTCGAPELPKDAQIVMQAEGRVAVFGALDGDKITVTWTERKESEESE